MVMKSNLFSPFGFDLLLCLFLQVLPCTPPKPMTHSSAGSHFLACTTSSFHTVLYSIGVACTSVVCTLWYRIGTVSRLFSFLFLDVTSCSI